jgi:predicted N-formylglutamate amidohydrolase
MDKLAIKKNLIFKKNEDQDQAFRILNQQGKVAILFLCDHASRRIPETYQNLGLSDECLQRHIAWDIGAAALTERLSAAFDAPAVLASFSRLLIDPNRAPECPTLIPEASDGITIPGNKHISAAERQYRIDQYYQPFHDACAGLIQAFHQKGVVPLVIGMHSFTPIMNNKARPWHAGLLWDKDPRLAEALISGLGTRPGLVVGDNEPYTGRSLFHTMQVHGAAHGFPQVTIEIRQDELESIEGLARWADILEDELQRILKIPEMQQIIHY